MSSSNAWAPTLTANVEAHFGWLLPYYEDIWVENMTGSVVWVDTSGGASTVGGANLDAVPANSSLLVSNRQPKLYKVSASAPGSTSQQLILPASGFATYVSLVTSGSGQVMVAPQ